MRRQLNSIDDFARILAMFKDCEFVSFNGINQNNIGPCARLLRTRLIRLMANSGTKFQFTLSPKTSLIRAPFRQPASPCGVPTVGDALEPRYRTSGQIGLTAVSLMTPPSLHRSWLCRGLNDLAWPKFFQIDVCACPGTWAPSMDVISADVFLPKVVAPIAVGYR